MPFVAVASWNVLSLAGRFLCVRCLRMLHDKTQEAHSWRWRKTLREIISKDGKRREQMWSIFLHKVSYICNNNKLPSSRREKYFFIFQLFSSVSRVWWSGPAAVLSPRVGHICLSFGYYELAFVLSQRHHHLGRNKRMLFQVNALRKRTTIAHRIFDAGAYSVYFSCPLWSSTALTRTCIRYSALLHFLNSGERRREVDLANAGNIG